MDSPNLEKIWRTVLGELEVDVGKGNFRLYFYKTTLVSLENGVAKVGFKNKAVADLVNARYYALIQTSLQKITQISPLSLVFEILPQEEIEKIEDLGPLFTEKKENREEWQAAVKRCGLRGDFTFEDFCVSTSNQLAFAAATAVAQTPGKSYNPFFIWGGVGVGKTHLMQAVGLEILRKNPRAKVIYASSEEFTNEIIAGIRSKNTTDFKNKYRSADALLIDDVQFLGGKDRVQEEFFHTFNTLQQKEGQVIMTSDRKPSDIKYIEDRLRSRFEGGMVTDISTPDTELKTAICVLKAKNRGIELSNDLAFILASNVDNIRTLEGQLQRIIIEAQSQRLPINADLINKILKVPATSNQQLATSISPHAILEKLCDYYNLPMKLIKGEKRDKAVAVPRQILMYLIRKNTGITYEEIAAFLGGRDHTTVMHGVQKIESLILTNEKIRNDVDKLGKSFAV